MSDLPVSAESSETAGSPQTATSLDVLLDAPRVTQAQNDYAAACEQARQMAMGWRQQMAQQEGNTVS
ncbi:MAG TPA: hypothetical protein VFR23_08600 [Jiangellaceae bacterium]|nr:hypothetical protein [Jiangellaceae bacterium]